jgi:hypothetical protein
MDKKITQRSLIQASKQQVQRKRKGKEDNDNKERGRKSLLHSLQDMLVQVLKVNLMMMKEKEVNCFI